MSVNAKELAVIVEVQVRRQWNSWRTAVYDLNHVENLHWDNMSGGVNAKAPRRFLHGYVWCNEMISW